MTTRWQHCSAEKLALRFQKLGVSVLERRELKLSLPLASKGPFIDRDDGSECEDYSRGFQDNKYLPHQL